MAFHPISYPVSMPVSGIVSAGVSEAFRYRGGGDSTPFPFNQPSLIGFWDVTNTASVTQSGGRISQINDLSGLGNHLTASGDSRPYYLGDGGIGYAVANFQDTGTYSTSQKMDATNTTTFGAQTISIWMRRNTPAGSFDPYVGNTGNNNYMLGAEGTANLDYRITGSANGSTALRGTGLLPGINYGQYVARFDRLQNTINIRYNGADLGTTTLSGVVADLTGKVLIGRNGFANNAANFDMIACMVFDSYLEGSDLTALEAY